MNVFVVGENLVGFVFLCYILNGVIGFEIEFIDLVGVFKYLVYIIFRVLEEEMVGIVYLVVFWGWEIELNLVGKLLSSK